MKISAHKTHVLFSKDFRKKEKIEFSIAQNSEETIIVVLTEDCDATVVAHIKGTRSNVTILGFIAGKAKKHMKLHTVQHHAAGSSTSNLLVKCALLDEAQFSYDGGIKVDKDAQKTDAYQRNENLLLSDSASARSKPALEILADDVRCTHGATMGTLREEELYYLSCRGIAGELARQLIVDGFFESALTRVPDESIREKVRKELWQTL